MDSAQRLLFGSEFPRRVGTPEQFWCYTAGHFDLVLDRIIGRKNAYATVSWFDQQLNPVCDKVALDFDSPEKEADWGLDEVERLKADTEFRDAVLDPVCEDVRKLAGRLQATGQPAVGVFSGMGVHVHLLHQPRKDPQTAMASTGWKHVERIGLDHVDHKVFKDVQRIMRVPNAERVEGDTSTGIWTVPLSLEELTSVTPEWLLDVSSSPRSGVVPEIPYEERPELEEHQEYLRSDFSEPVESVEVNVDFESFDDEYLKRVMEELLKMPCMYERALQPNPSHEVRRNMAVLLFNCGLEPDDVLKLMSRLGWRDWDRGFTRKQLEQIYRVGYSDMNCQSIKSVGLCTRDGGDEDCETEGWSGGRAEWKQSKL